jgi:hypothetical protein
MSRMKKTLAVAAVLIAWAGIPASLSPQEPAAAPEAVAVRVWDGDRFVSDLGLQDFEFSENGLPQPIEALYLINKNAVERRDGGRDFQPDVSRKFYFIFQMFEYNPKLAEAVLYFFENVFQPGDSLEVQTPMHVYRLSPQALAQTSKDVVAKDMADKVKKDISIGNSLYRNLLGELKRFVRSLEGTQSMAQIGEEGGEEAEGFTMELVLPMYRDSLMKLESLRAVDEKKLLAFARAVKSREGQKFVFYVYQREFRPEISPRLLQDIISVNQEKPHILAAVQELFQVYSRSVSLNPDRIQQAFADSGIVFNFLFMNKNPETYSGIVMREQSDDAFRALSQVAGNSGGVVDNSQNPAASITKALNASERYYLLYYFPESKAKDGTFRKFDVKIKGKEYRVIFRGGRFSQ